MEEIQDAVYVTMEILSNWGDLAWVGLLEVEFFDQTDTKLYVSPHDVDIRNTDVPGNLSQLVNRHLAGSGTVCVWNTLSLRSLDLGERWGSVVLPELLPILPVFLAGGCSSLPKWLVLEFAPHH